MRTVQMSVAAILGTMAVIAGCGHTGANASGAAGAGGSSSPAAAASSSPSGGVPVSGKNVTLSAAQNGKIYIVQKGTTLFVFLRGTPTQMWKPIRSSSESLKPAANGRLALMLGETAASFVAATPGTAVISSTRALCSSSSGSPTPAGVAQCGVIQSYRVTVVVQG
ncbi:MAG TPA: hypothetical protein VKS82_24205 [Streptosporangiaceae bacterium]|nr:hypothetical protein [Streptosporangiaceae bacterium]